MQIRTNVLDNAKSRAIIHNRTSVLATCILMERKLWIIGMSNKGGRLTYKQRKAKLSFDETKNLSSRDVRCPDCGHKLITAFEDCCGHVSLYCNKCHDYRTIDFGIMLLGA